MSFEVGKTFELTRTFTRESVAAFARVSGDEGSHHVDPDEQGRVMVHGLHTASIATQIGGSINFISRDMHFDFLAPVFSGDTVTCVATVQEAQQRARSTGYRIDFVFENQHGTEVCRGFSSGVVRE